ncbi:APC family permease [Agromyces sp. NPDC056379]|uniref:APC family permease n=1 Tax=unclassified Agromyces TaxID=2639701 RepID=UPI0035DD472E
MTEERSPLALKRVLTLKYLVVFGLAYLAPTVVFNYYGIITSLTGGMMALAYVVTTIVMFFTAYSYASMVKAYPIAGSAYTYVQRAVNPWLGFLTGWVMLIDYLLLPMICYLLFGIYMNEFVPGVPVAVWVVAAAALGAWTNIAGVKVTGRINMVVIGAQVLFCVVLIGLIIGYVVQGGGSGTLFVPEAIYNPATFDAGNVLWAASILAVSFLGFDAVSTMAEETVKPEKTVPRAIMIVCIGAGIAFALISYFTQIAWPTGYRDIVDEDAGIFELLGRLGGDALSTTFLVTDNLASFICAMAGLAAVSRVLYGMGRDGALPKRFFGTLSARFRTPVNNILLTSAIALTAVFYADNLMGAASLMSFGALTGFALVNYSVISHYFIRGGRRHGWDAVRFLVLPAIGVAVCIMLWVSIDSSAKILGLVWVVLGVIYLAFSTRGFRRPPGTIRLDEDAEVVDA